MYQCSCCGQRFEQTRQYWEHHGEYFGFPAFERVSGCPHCGGGYFELPTAAAGGNVRWYKRPGSRSHSIYRRTAEQGTAFCAQNRPPDKKTGEETT